MATGFLGTYDNYHLKGVELKLKKIIQSILIISFIFLLMGCVDNTPKDLPVFEGIDDVEVELGAVFNPLLDVKAFDVEGTDITDLIELSGIEVMSLFQGRTTNTGAFEIIYTVTDLASRTQSQTRVVTVIYVEAQDPNLVGCPLIQLEGYTLTWCDEFTGEGTHVNNQGVDLNKWAFQTGTGSQYGLTGWGNNEQQFYLQDNVRIEDGRLLIEAKKESIGGMPYTSARIWTQPTFGQKYGRFEASIKLPIGDGLWPAFWLLPVNSPYGTWARSGEIDIMEARGRFPNVSTGALHYGDTWPNNTYRSANYNFPAGMNINQFHQYAIEWEENEIRWYVNGNLYFRMTDWYATGHDFPAPFDTEFYIILNLAIGGTFDGNRLPPDALFDEPVLMEVEYVRVYSKND